MDIGPAHLDDLDLLVDASVALGRESEGREPDADTVRKAIQAAIEDPSKARYFVARDEGRVLGSLFVTFEWSDWNAGWYWWIQGVYVATEARRRGVYRALYQAVQEAAAGAGARRVRLYVHEENPARSAYEALGMHEEPYRIYDAVVAPAPANRD